MIQDTGYKFGVRGEPLKSHKLQNLIGGEGA